MADSSPLANCLATVFFCYIIITQDAYLGYLDILDMTVIELRKVKFIANGKSSRAVFIRTVP